LGKIAAGHPLLDNTPVTVIASASDLRPWRTCARQCAVLRGHSFQIVENWQRGDATRPDVVRELMPEI
jgi:hypothetical protein